MIFGAPGAIRTPDLRIRSPLLYPAELQAHIKLKEKKRLNNKIPCIVQDKFLPIAKVESALALTCKMLYPSQHFHN